MQAKRRLLGAGILFGILLMLSPVAAIVVSLHSAFATLGESGIGDPRSLAGSVRELLVSSTLLLPLLLGGTALLTWSLMQRRKLRDLEPPSLPILTP